MHRRQTLANDASSALPVPSTAARNRQSMVPGPKAGRPSSIALGSSQQSSIPATVGRTGNTYTSGGGGVALGWSGARGDAGNLRSSHAPTTVRRSSVYTGTNNNLVNRRQSTFPGAALGATIATPASANIFGHQTRQAKDPRNVKDRAFQKHAREDIYQFLEARGYSFTPLTERTLSNPTTKDFHEIFKFLYHIYDGKPVSSLGSLQKKFEDEIHQLLRTAGYPYAADITKSHLQAIGAQHTWPGMLAMLHWFVQSITAREGAFETYPDLHVDTTQLDAPGSSSRVQYRTEMWAEYLASAYPAFMASEDYDIEGEKQRLEDRFREAGESTRAETLRNIEEIEKLKGEYEALSRQGSNLEKHRQEQQKLDTDIKQMEEYLQRLETGIRKYGVKCEEFRKKITELDQQGKAATAERENLTKVVEKQNLSDVDIHRLTSDRQTLDGKLRIARSEREEKSKRTYDLEIKRSQAYNLIERLVEDYESKATKLGLIPHPPKGYEHIDFYQELNGSANTPAAMVPDCTTVIKPAVARLKQDTMNDRRQEEDKVLSLEEELADLKDKLNTRYTECEDAELRYKALAMELNTAKESLNNEMAAATSELDKLQQQCTSIRAEMSGGNLAIDQRLQALRNEHDKLISDVEKLRRDNQQAFAQQLEAIVSYKAYVIARVGDMAAEVAL